MFRRFFGGDDGDDYNGSAADSSPVDFDFRTARTFYDKQEAKLNAYAKHQQNQQRQQQQQRNQSNSNNNNGCGSRASGGGHKGVKRHSNLSLNNEDAYGEGAFADPYADYKRSPTKGRRGGSNNCPQQQQGGSSPNCLQRAYRRCTFPIRRFLQRNVLPVPIDHDLYMTTSIWGKLVRYRHVPYFFIVNILLCGLLVGYIEAYQLFINDYVVQSRYALSSMMVGAEDETDSSLTSEFTNINDFTEFVEAWVSGYYSIPMDSIGVFQHFAVGEEDPSVAMPQLEMRYAKDRTYSQFYTLSFDLTEDDPLGPFNNVSELISRNETCLPYTDFDHNHVIPCRNGTVADFFDMFVSAQIRGELRGVVANPAYGYSSTLKWIATTAFTFNSHNSQMMGKTSLDYLETQRLATAPVYVVVVIALLSMFGIVSKLNWWARHSSYPRFAKSEGHIRKYRTAVNWNFYGVFADAVSLSFSIFTITANLFSFLDYNMTQWKCVALGSAAFVQILFIVSHFQNVPRMYVIAQSIANALPNLGAYFVSVFPMFFGFCICASAGFGGLTDMFNSLPSAMISFFCMIGGDSLLDIYTGSNQTTELPLQIYTAIVLAGFVIFFVGCMLNMMLAIVQDSYTVGRALSDMDERVMKEIRREDAQKKMLSRHYNEAKKSGLDNGGEATRKTFKAAMVGGATDKKKGGGAGGTADGADGRGQQQRYEAFTTAELIALRKRFHVMPRVNVGLDISSSSSSSSSSDCCSDGDFRIDEGLRRTMAQEQKQKLRKTREMTSSANAGGGRPISPARGGGGGGGGRNGAVGGGSNTTSIMNSLTDRRARVVSPTLAAVAAHQQQQQQEEQQRYGTPTTIVVGELGGARRGPNTPPIAHLSTTERLLREYDDVPDEEDIRRRDERLFEVSSVNTEYLLSTEGYDARQSSSVLGRMAGGTKGRGRGKNGGEKGHSFQQQQQNNGGASTIGGDDTTRGTFLSSAWGGRDDTTVNTFRSSAATEEADDHDTMMGGFRQ